MNKKKINNVADYEKNIVLRNLAIGIAILIVFLSLPGFCTGDCGHSHDNHQAHDPHHHHHHDGYVEEPASYKWSRAANEALDSSESNSASHEHQHNDHGHDHHDAHDHIHHHHHPQEHTHEHKVPKSKPVQGKSIKS